MAAPLTAPFPVVAFATGVKIHPGNSRVSASRSITASTPRGGIKRAVVAYMGKKASEVNEAAMKAAERITEATKEAGEKTAATAKKTAAKAKKAGEETTKAARKAAKEAAEELKAREGGPWFMPVAGAVVEEAYKKVASKKITTGNQAESATTASSAAVKEKDEVKEEKVDSAGTEISDATSQATEAVEEGVIEEV